MTTFISRAALVTLLVATVGCARTTQVLTGVTDSAVLRVQNSQELAKVRQESNSQLAAERLEAKQIAAERQRQELQIALQRQKMEMQFCQANQEAQRQALQNQLREDVHSKVAFDVIQGLDVGELEVDMDELEQLLQQREQNQAQIQAQAQAARKGCGCDERHCGCRPGLKRRDCGACQKTSCGCPEKDCGGPAALAQAMQNAHRPLRPQEIPLKLPVRLSFGMQQPNVEAAQIRPRPYAPQSSPQNSPQQKNSVQKNASSRRSTSEDARLSRLPSLPQPPRPVFE
ncbi:MAG: hypothetical protein QGG36_27670 [Pirellulaceae bacterium]|nr:hypothetical protein [Pirellulaceae bacterium]